MALNRSKSEQSHDDGYWSIVADFIDRRDRGEVVDPVDFAKGDPALANRLRDCLAGFGWLEQAISGSDSGPEPIEGQRMPESIGEYSIIRELGRGGMGVVYEAVHQGLGRRVALKVLFDSAVQGRTARERFMREAKTAASLHHTNIVPVFDVGSADGHLYFAMQLIDGRSLEALSVESRAVSDGVKESGAAASPAAPDSVLSFNAQLSTINPSDIARLGQQAAEALAYAHARGVVHRDIKPSNLILDSSGTVWVADFGLARGPEDSGVTATGARVGTPRYMSPEQAMSQRDAMDARTDIYSLGVTLYELLTGQPLFSPSTPQQLLYQIIRAEPVRPRRLNSRIPRDLETIVLKAMAKRPADRYGSAQALANDLRRFLVHEPVRARRIGPAGRLIRWCRREPVVAAISLVSLTALAAVAGIYQQNLTTQRDVAVSATAQARHDLADALFERARAVRATQEIGRRWLALDLLKQSDDILPRAELRFEAVRTLELFDVRRTDHLKELGGPVSAVAFDVQSRRVAVAVDDRAGASVSIWDRSTDSAVGQFAAPGAIHSLAFSPDGRRLAGSTVRHVCLWDLDSGGLQLLPGGRSGLSNVAFDSDGRRLFGFAQGLCVWDVPGGKLEAKLVDAETEIGHVAVSGDGRYLAAAVATPDESRAEIRRWSLPDLKALEPLRVRDLRPDPLAEAMGVLALAASPTGPVVAASCGDSRIRLWDGQTGKPLAVLEGHRAPPVSLAFTADGDMLVSTDRFEVKLWDTRGGELASLIRPDSAEIGPLPALALSRDGTIATTGDFCQLWELATPTFHRVLARGRDRVTAIAASPDGRWMGWTTRGRVAIWNRADAELRHELALDLRGEIAVAFLPDGRSVVAVGDAANAIQLFDIASGKPDAAWPAEPATAVAASPCGRELAVAHTDGAVRRWNVATGQVIAALVGHVGPVTSLAYSPDGQRLVAGTEDRSGAEDRTIHLWEVATGKLIRTQAAHRTITFGVAFSPDGRRLASCGGDRTVKVWDAASGELVQALTGHSQAVRSVAWNSDGSQLASCSLDGHLFIWEPTSGRLMADLTSRASGSLAGVTFTAADRSVLSCGGPFRWTHTGPGSVEAWDLSKIEQELSRLGLK
jgi:WD40 repeat protein/serine/threonine protein kinase